MTLWGHPVEGARWTFALERNESALTDLLSDEDEDLLPLLGSKQKQFVDSWEEALKLLDAYPWQWMFPIEVHPDFAELLWETVQRRLSDEHRLRRWHSALHGAE